MDKTGIIIQQILAKEFKALKEEFEERLGPIEERLGPIEERLDSIDTKLFSLRYDLDELKENVEQLNSKSDKHYDNIMIKLDFIYGKIKKMDDSQEMLSYRVTEHTNEIDKHEKRILKIEKSPAFITA